MFTPRINVEGVWKKFRRGEVYDSLRDLIPAIGRRLVGHAPVASDELTDREFWALRDVSFKVEAGEALGIVGRNGAGKSTSLKVLTRILRPTRGRYEVRGRIGSLIEVAAGFHQDLTGRENVFLQGAIMGMARADTARKFDAIVEFSGIGDFIDTPVKRYSSGMNARLGFSIAAHLDPDVLIIDEVLAVGDFAFQQKAFGRIRELARSGLPVVVVSHQLDRIAELCTRVVVLDAGRVTADGAPGESIATFLAGAEPAAPGCRATDPLVIESLTVHGPGFTRSGEVCGLELTGTVLGEVPAHYEPIAFRVRSAQTGQVVFASSTSRCGVALPAAGRFRVDLGIQMNLPAGMYTLETMVWDSIGERIVSAGPSAPLRVNPGASFFGSVQLNPTVRITAEQPAFV